MPQMSVGFTSHHRQRLKMYFSELINANAESKRRIGRLVGVGSSRVSAWANGDRLISAEKAFELGEALRDDFKWETSGAEFLWACGYWPEILELVKHLASQDDFGFESATFLFCWLPGRMHSFEVNVVNQRFAEKLDLNQLNLSQEISKAQMAGLFKKTDLEPRAWIGETLDLQSRIRELINVDCGAREAERYLVNKSVERYERWDDPFQELITELDIVCRGDGFRSKIVEAWENFNNGALRSLSHALVGSGRSVGRIELHVIDAMIDAARNLNEAMLPTYAAPRIWRMTGNWLYEIAPELMTDWSKALPDNFVSHPELAAREAGEQEILDYHLKESDGHDF